jgi:hypothetical protein
VRQVVLAFALGCGGHGPPPKPPPPAAPDPKQLAHDINDDMVQLVRIAHDNRGNCNATISQLQAHNTRMIAHHDQAMKMSRDKSVGARLVTEMEAYAGEAQGRGGQILSDLAATHKACGEGCRPDAPCQPRYQLERVIGDIPVY